MNHITVHGKVTKKAEMKLLNINGEPVPVAVFTVVDIGLPYQQVEPTYFFVNYPKDAASLIAEYLVENKEVLVHGMMRQKFSKDKDGNKVLRYYLRADMVELLPVFTQRGAGKEKARRFGTCDLGTGNLPAGREALAAVRRARCERARNLPDNPRNARPQKRRDILHKALVPESRADGNPQSPQGLLTAEQDRAKDIRHALLPASGADSFLMERQGDRNDFARGRLALKGKLCYFLFVFV